MRCSRAQPYGPVTGDLRLGRANRRSRSGDVAICGAISAAGSSSAGCFSRRGCGGSQTERRVMDGADAAHPRKGRSSSSSTVRKVEQCVQASEARMCAVVGETTIVAMWLL